MEAAQRLAMLADCAEHFGRRGIGHAGEVDLEKLCIGFAIFRRVKHAIDVVEDLDFIRALIACRFAESAAFNRVFVRSFNRAG